MVKSSENNGSQSQSQSVAPFLKKCYDMVDDESTASIISWGQNNDSFVIWDMTQFSVQLLPKYFKHSNYSSFIRQLNIYGFRKIDTDRWEFASDGFIRGQKHLLKNIIRRKHVHGTDNRKSHQQEDISVEPCEKVESLGLWKEVENLKADKNALMQELIKLRQHHETAENKLLVLRDRLQGMEKNQQQMLSLLVMVMQRPAFLVQLLQPKENNWRMAEPGTIVEQGADDVEPLASDGMIVRYHPPIDETPKPVQVLPIGLEKPQESDSDEMKDFSVSPDFMKVLMDENLSYFENHSPFVLPELLDDSEWEQLFLASPFLEVSEDGKRDSNETTDAEIPMGIVDSRTLEDRSQNFGSLIEKMDKSPYLEKKSADGVQSENQNLESLTRQLSLLAPETHF